MKKIIYWVLLLGCSVPMSGQSLKDELHECVQTYRRYVNYFMAADTRNRTDLMPGFEKCFLTGAYLEHALPQLAPQLTPRQFGIGLSGFSDNTELKWERAYYCRHETRVDVCYIHVQQVFVGDYLQSGTAQTLPPQNMTLTVVKKQQQWLISGVKKAIATFAAPNLTDPDHDEIPSVCDKCPNMAGGLEYYGADPVEDCAASAQPQSKPVVIDSDGDGTPDANDKCPNQFGEPEDGGCPNYTENELRAIAIIEEAKRSGADSLNLAALGLKRLPSIIKNLKGLKKLYLNAYGAHYQHRNFIEDISVICDLKQLAYLNLSGCPIKDVAALSQLPILTELDLSSTLIDQWFVHYSQISILKLKFGYK